MHTSVAKKLFAVGTALATILGGLAPLAAVAAPHAAGTNVKSSDGTIWMITSEGTRRAYTSAGAFLSYGFNSFASVMDANSDDLALPAGSFIPPQDGKIICSDRGADKGTCYLITNGQKGGFTSAAVFTGLGFSFSRATYGDVSWMSSTSNIDNTTMAHRPGVLVNNNGTVQLVGANGLLGIPDIATFNSWGYSFADVVPANAADKAMTQTGVMAARVAGQLSPSFTTGGNPPPANNGPLTVSLASDNPASNAVITNQAAADLAHFTFTGSGTVTGLTLKRTGVSADSSLSNVYLFDGATRITDAASVGSNSQINFNSAAGLFTVNGSKTIWVKVDLNATAGETLGIQLLNYTVSGGSPVAVNLSGNIFAVASAALATASFGSATPSTSTVDPANDTVVWQSTLTVGTRDVVLKRMALRQTNSINSSDIRNFRLLVDGQQVAQTSSLDANGYVTFAPSPTTLKTGARNFKVIADVVGGSSRKITMSLRNKADIELVDSNYNAALTISSSVPLSAGDLTVSSASVTVQKASDSPSGNVTLNGSDVTLGKWTVQAYGEPVKVDTLTVGYTHSTSSAGTDTETSTLRNGRLLINGGQYGSTQTISKSGTSFTVNYTFPVGTAVTVEFRADVYDNDGSSNMSDTDVMQAKLVAGSSNGQGTVSASSVNVPGSAVTANSVTVSAGSISLAKNATYANQSTVVPQNAYKVASFNLTGNSTEDVNVNTINVDFTASGTFSTADLSNVYVMYNGTKLQTKSSVSSSAGVNSWNLSQTLAKNAVVPVEVYADIGSTITSGDAIYASSTVSGTTVASGQTVTTSDTTGQTITAQSGSVSAAIDASTPVAAIVDDSQTVTAAAFKFTTTYDAYTVTDVTVSVASTSPVTSVVLKDGSTVLQTKPGASSVTFSGLSLAVPANSTKVLTVDIVLATVGTGAATSGSNIKVTLTSAKANSSTGSQVDVTESNPAGNDMYVFKAIPTVSNSTLPTSVLTAGTATLAKTTISSGGTGTIGVSKIVWTVNKTATPTITAGTLAVYDADTNTTIAGTVTSSANLSGSATSGTVTFTPTSEIQISGSKTFVLKGTVAGSLATGDYITTNIAAAQSSLAAGAAAGSQTGNLVWSDVSALSHDTTTTDWYGDYLVKNIPTDAQTLSK